MYKFPLSSRLWSTYSVLANAGKSEWIMHNVKNAYEVAMTYAYV